ncbi:hypothetical protein BVI2075_320061 [Burkholderia vietnamiensis]|nr:hypothetical protein BVI2075_320061 [Burkholderia vietnamiensis]
MRRRASSRGTTGRRAMAPRVGRRVPAAVKAGVTGSVKERRRPRVVERDAWALVDSVSR